MPDVWIEKKPKAKRGPHRGKVRYRVRARGFTGTGIEKQTLSRTFTAKSAAEQYKEHLLAGHLVPEKMTVAEVARRLIDFDCSVKSEASAFDYTAIINNHIIRYIGDKEISQLKKMDVEIMRKRICSEPLTRDGLTKTKPPGPRVANKALMVLKVLLNRAEDDQVILGNEPNIKAIRRMKPLDYDPREGIALTVAESERLIAAAAQPYRDLILVALNTGMRQGEILGLDWADISLRDRTITLRRQFTRNKLKDTLKTKNAKRDIPINDVLLSRLRETQLRSDLSQWLFPGKGDLPINGQNLLRQGFYPASVKAGLTSESLVRISQGDRLWFHDLRHTVNTRLIERGVSEVIIQSILGHAKNSMTGHYGHIDMPTKLRAVNRLCEFEQIGDNVALFSSPIPSPITGEK